ncbi:MAG TPA: GAF domain-containing protein, partial [Longimicrobiales bacterium]|nr:GAF domain-containing protein [Longimicrobiales bacterium]
MNAEHRTPAASFQERYSVLVDVARVLNSTLRTGELYRAIHQQAIRVLDSTGFYIALYDEVEDTATVVFASERGETSFPGLRYRGSDSPAIREGRPAISHTGEIAARRYAAMGVRVPSLCSLHAPMVREGRVLGLISA